ncbi:hypothetical protein ISS07_02665 [Candidatus Woesearchaeota archaeon]|nr:hypothetical protein [Candidatus Woesearchaeota archaeon]
MEIYTAYLERNLETSTRLEGRLKLPFDSVFFPQIHLIRNFQEHYALKRNNFKLSMSHLSGLEIKDPKLATHNRVLPSGEVYREDSFFYGRVPFDMVTCDGKELDALVLGYTRDMAHEPLRTSQDDMVDFSHSMSLVTVLDNGVIISTYQNKGSHPLFTVWFPEGKEGYGDNQYPIGVNDILESMREDMELESSKSQVSGNTVWNMANLTLLATKTYQELQLHPPTPPINTDRVLH